MHILYLFHEATEKPKSRNKQTKYQWLTQTPVGNHNMRVTIALLPPPLAPVLDRNWLVGFNNIGDLQFRVDLALEVYKKR